MWHRTEDWPVAPDRVFNTLNTQEVRFSPDHRHVVLAGRDVRLWELQRPAAPSLALPTPETLHRAARFSPDGRWLAVGGTLGPVYLWDMAAADRPASIVTLSGHTSEIRDVAFDPSGRWMATAGADHTVRLWDMSVSNPSGAHCIVFRPRLGDLISVGFADRGRWLFTGDTDGSLVAWSMDRTAAANELRERIGRGFTPPERREFQIE